jgi:hypothetical protein
MPFIVNRVVPMKEPTLHEKRFAGGRCGINRARKIVIALAKGLALTRIHVRIAPADISYAAVPFEDVNSR